jgi:hypothetical protein
METDSTLWYIGLFLAGLLVGAVIAWFRRQK